MNSYFTKPDTWSGGFYELALEVGPRSDSRLLAALKALWDEPALEGCYLDCERDPHLQKRVEVGADLLERDHFYGLATLPNGDRVACGTYLLRLEDDSDWLDFYVPMGSLATALPVGAFPFGDMLPHEPWRSVVDNWLAEIGTRVYCKAPFTLGLIGHEAAAELSAARVNAEGIPRDYFHDILWPRGGSIDRIVHAAPSPSG